MDLPKAMSVRDLIECLRFFPDDTPVVALYDCRCAGGTVVALEMGPGPDDTRDSAVLIVE
jgi:hypothetical protein